MKQLDITIEDLMKISNGKTLVCFGAGGYLTELISNDKYYKLGIFQKVDYILDNNPYLHETYFEQKQIRKKIFSINTLTQEKECYIIITIINGVADVVDQLKNIHCEGGFVVWNEILNKYKSNNNLNITFLKKMKNKPQIPKIIHFCWFGDKEIPEKEKKCIESWSKYCPDYELQLWNESNFDVRINEYVYEAYVNKKYAFVTDFVRLWAIYNFGGIYMDTDVEVLQNLDCFLGYNAFSGFEQRFYIPTGIMGGEYHSKYFEYLLSYYKDKHFIIDGQLDMTTNVVTITNMTEDKYNISLSNSYLETEDFTMFPQEVFCPIDYATKTKNITENTYAIHWFNGSWLK